MQLCERRMVSRLRHSKISASTHARATPCAVQEFGLDVAEERSLGRDKGSEETRKGHASRVQHHSLWYSLEKQTSAALPVLRREASRRPVNKQASTGRRETTLPGRRLWRFEVQPNTRRSTRLARCSERGSSLCRVVIHITRTVSPSFPDDLSCLALLRRLGQEL